MAHWFLESRDHTVQFPFLQDGGPVIPDLGSVYLTVRDHIGLALIPWDRAALPDPNNTHISVTLPSTLFQLNVGDRWQARFVELEYAVNGIVYKQPHIWKITTFIPIAVTADDVRMLLGLNSSELPDEAVDIYQAYYDLSKEDFVGFNSALIGTAFESMGSNKAIMFKAALNVMLSAPLRVLLEERKEFHAWIRNRVDFEAMKAALENGLTEALGIAGLGTYELGPLLYVPTIPDPITGA